MKYTPIIGLEVHVELATHSKMFCGCVNDPFGASKPNIYTCPVCLGLPGALPVPNKKAVEWTIKLGLALGCSIPKESKFDRKNYFYPDLAKGYQISQYDQPLAEGGSLEVSVKEGSTLVKKTIRIRRVHLEEDTGKLQHATIVGKKQTLVDFNRSGVPLVEIVTEPDFRSIEEVDAYVKALQQIVRYIEISGADLEKGTMRLEPSISLSTKQVQTTSELPPYRVELKNINSFRFARRALEYEFTRQSALLDKGQTPTQQTRGWNEDKNATLPQRDKEEAHDYRYFPEPDIPPMVWTKVDTDKIGQQIPELPQIKKERFMKAFGLSEYDAFQLIDTKEKADFFESCIHEAKQFSDITPKKIANWIINKKQELQGQRAKQFVTVIREELETSSMAETELLPIISQVLSANAKAIDDYKNGKAQSLMFLVGQVMRVVRGKATAEQVQTTLLQIIEK